MIIIASVLAVYYPTNFAEICLVDDYGAISYYFSEETFSLKEIFFPQSAGGGYYRPLIALSYILDKQLWFLHERLMHLESVVAHLINGLLVFFICREAVALHLKRCETWLPLVTTLLFTLHPVTTESVNWISGRTDIMMGTFILVSVICLLRFIQNRSKLMLTMATISGLIACLAKEAAFGYLIAMPMLALYRVDCSSTQSALTNLTKVRLYAVYFSCAFLTALLAGSYWLVLFITSLYLLHITYKKFKADRITFSTVRVATWAVVIITVATAGVGLFVLLRRLAFTSNTGKIGQTITLMLADMNYTISIFLGAIGFYVKKFFLPMPLNFFILEIDPLYDFVGIAVLLMVCHLFVQLKKLPAIMALIGLLLLLPALPFAFGTIAWTAYAERYIYLSSAFWIIALSLWGGNWLERAPTLKPLVTTLIVIVCIFAAGITFSRNKVWQNNVTLMRDTIEQTPRIRKLRNIYIKALLDKDQTSEALEQYRLASADLPSPDHDEHAELMIGGKLVAELRYKDAMQLYQDALHRSNYESQPLLTSSISLIKTMITLNSLPKHEIDQLTLLLDKYSVLSDRLKQKKQSSSRDVAPIIKARNLEIFNRQ